MRFLIASKRRLTCWRNLLWPAVNETIWAQTCAAFQLRVTSSFTFPVSDGIEVVRVMSGRRDIRSDDVK